MVQHLVSSALTALACLCAGVAGEEGKVDSTTEPFFELICSDPNYSLLDLTPVREDRMLQVDELEIYFCKLPKESYLETLKTIKINATTTSKLKLLAVDHMPQAKHFEGLNVEYLCINKAGNMLSTDSERHFLETLPTLKKLSLQFPTDVPKTQLNLTILLPVESAIESVELCHAETTAAFGGCSALEQLTLTFWKVLASNWLANCTKLRTLYICDNSEENLLRILSEARMLTSLQLNWSEELNVTEEFFTYTEALRDLALASMSKVNIHSGALKSLNQLERLEIWSHSELIFNQVQNELVPLRSLRSLDMCCAKNTSSYCATPKLSITSNSSTTSNETADKDITIAYTCTVMIENPECVHVLQWHQLDGNKETSNGTWRAAASKSVTMRLRMTEEVIGTTLLCRGVFDRITLETKITVNDTDTE